MANANTVQALTHSYLELGPLCSLRCQPPLGKGTIASNFSALPSLAP